MAFRLRRQTERKDVNGVAPEGAIPIKSLVSFFIDSKEKAPERKGPAVLWNNSSTPY